MKRNRKSLVGQRIDDLFVEELLGVDERNSSVYLCRCCLCGRKIIIKAEQLLKHQVKNCGCKRVLQNNGHDLTGKRFGILTALEYVGRKNHSAQWRCVCDCGNEIITPYSSLKSGNRKTCGSPIHKIKKDLTGKRFGRLLVIEPSIKNGHLAWKCRCDCGNEVIVPSRSLNSGNTKSCGCLKHERL